jgi:hypothetical protein
MIEENASMTQKENDEAPLKLITCSVHWRVPGCIVCGHLVEGTATKWRAVLRRPGVLEDEGHQTDWICPECGDKFPEIPLDDLRLLCVFHARKLRGVT